MSKTCKGIVDVKGTSVIEIYYGAADVEDNDVIVHFMNADWHVTASAFKRKELIKFMKRVIKKLEKNNGKT